MSEIFKNIYTPFNACCYCYCLCYICIQKGKHINVGGKKKKIERCRSERVIALECVFWIRLICLYICVCLLKEQWGCYVIISIPVMDVWIDIFHIIDMEMCTYSVICYTYCYTFDMLSLTTGLPMWICSYFFLFTFSPPQRFLTVHDNMVPFSLTQPVIIVHRVNLALFYFAFVFLFLEPVSELSSSILRL